jgi:hypothetical protein
MQRGASASEREPFVSSSELYAQGAKIVLTRSDLINLSPSGREVEWFETLRVAVQAMANNGFRKPRDVARLLNAQGYRTAVGNRWSPRIAWFLLNRLYTGCFDGTGHPDVATKPAPNPHSREPGPRPTPAKSKIRIELPGRTPLSANEVAARKAALQRSVTEQKGPR